MPPQITEIYACNLETGIQAQADALDLFWSKQLSAVV